MKKLTVLLSIFFATAAVAQVKKFNPQKPLKVAETPKIFVFDNALKKINITDKSTLQVGNNASNSIKETVKQAEKTTKVGTKNCTTSSKDYKAATADFGYFVENGTPEFIKPGVLMSYNDVLTGNNKINTTPREPLTIYLERTSAALNVNNLSEVVSSPHQISMINNALGKMNAKISNNVPANMAIEISEISSEEQLQYGLSGSYNNKMAGVGAKFGISNSDFSSSYYYMIKFTQSMYKIAVDASTFKFINNSVPNADKLCYISEVLYGRKGFLLIKTKKSKSQLEASLGVKLSVGVQSGNVDAFLNKVKEDKESQVNTFFYGGSASAAAQSVQNIDIKAGFNSWIAANAGQGLQALPISYKLKNLNGDQLVLNSVFSVNQQTCIPVKEYRLQIELEQVKNYKSNDYDNIDDYVMEFEPILVINNKNYPLAFKQYTTKQSITKNNSNHLYYFDENNPANQLHVAKGATQLIKNSGVFIIPEDVDLKNAKLQIKFRVFEKTGAPKDRIIGISDVQGYNIHNHSLIDIITVLTGATKLDKNTYTRCTEKCKGTQFGNYGGTTKYFLTGDTVPFEDPTAEYDEKDGSSKRVTSILRAGEYMLNKTKTRTFGINYTFKLLN